MLLATAIKQVAHLHGQEISRIHYVGAADNGYRWFALCGACTERRIRAPQYFEENDGPQLMQNEPEVEMVARMTQVDNLTLTSYTLLTGQCEDCGEVYFARFPGLEEG